MVAHGQGRDRGAEGQRPKAPLHRGGRPRRGGGNDQDGRPYPTAHQ